MDYETESRKLIEEQNVICAQIEGLKQALSKITDKKDALEEERIKNSRTEFTPEEEKWLRDELTVVGKILMSPDVVFGHLEYLNEEPDEMHTRGYFRTEHSNKFSIKIDLSICTEFRASLRCNVTVKSKFSNVEEIMREMFESTGYRDGDDKFQTYWGIDWDYHDRIILKKPYVHPDDEKEKV